MSNLFKLQTEFSVCVAKLILFLIENGYEVTFGDAYRDERCSYGHPKSVHRKRLAIDLNLFRNGEYLEDSEDHRRAGNFWKKLNPNARWGGDFKNSKGEPEPDGNHYSFEYEGMK